MNDRKAVEGSFPSSHFSILVAGSSSISKNDRSRYELKKNSRANRRE